MELVNDFFSGKSWFIIWLISAIAYLLVAYGIAYIVFVILYRLFKKEAHHRKIQPAYTTKKMVNFELRMSFSTLFIHTLAGLIVIYFASAGHTFVYTDIREHSIGYFIISILLMILLHDTYFYWTHRLMHLPGLYPIIHKTHHVSINPSPWAAYSGDPWEAAIAGGIFPLIAWTIPAHWLAMVIFLIYMLFMSVMGHAGFEFYPKGFSKSWIGRWQTTASHHNMHHQYFEGNYGIYFNFWDKLMKTERHDYHEHYNKLFDDNVNEVEHAKDSGK